MRFVHKIFENSLPTGRIFVRPNATEAKGEGRTEEKNAVGGAKRAGRKAENGRADGEKGQVGRGKTAGRRRENGRTEEGRRQVGVGKTEKIGEKFLKIEKKGLDKPKGL